MEGERKGWTQTKIMQNTPTLLSPQGDCICLHYNAKRYYIDVVEVRPGDAVSVIETDCEVDFAPPLDYVEPTRPPPAASAPSAAAASDTPSSSAAPSEAGGGAAEPAEAEEPAFKPFVGSGRRLDGKPSPAGAVAGAPPAAAPAAAPPAAPAAPPRPAGTVVFGGGNRLLAKQQAAAAGGGGAERPPPPPVAKKPAAGEDDKNEEEPSFKAFTGKPRSLRD